MLESISLNSKERTKKRRQRRSLINNFGINADQYEAILKEQNGVCAICYQPEPCNRMLAVDHCHTTNKIRGLLCSNCNTALGLCKDDLLILTQAIAYLGD